MSMDIQGQGLNTQPLRQDGSFNWVYLIEYITDGVLALFFLFYFNRLLGFLVAYVLRFFTWHAFRVYIDIEALQLSPLAGRIFFKGIRYHGENETIFIHSGYLTWRYWFRRVKDAEIFQVAGEESTHTDKDSVDSAWSGSPEDQRRASSSRRQKSLPCRIDVQVSGIEAFLHNRSPAYDYVLECINKRGDSHETVKTQQDFTHHSEKVGYRDLHRRKHEGNGLSGTKIGSEGSSEDGAACPSALSQAPWVLFFLRMLPVSVHASKGAAVLGNENTKSVITAKFDSSDGTFDATGAGPLDLFKILINFKVKKLFVQMRPNYDYKRTQEEEAVSLRNEPESSSLQKQSGSKPSRLQRLSAKLLPTRLRWDRFAAISMHARKSLESIRKVDLPDKKSPLRPDALPQGRWVGLARYLEDEQIDEHDEWDAVEYAKSSTLADIKSLGFKFYWDIPGTVPVRNQVLPPVKGDINGMAPPEYGMELSVYGGHVNYGPWADRHRVNLQQMFFPVAYADYRPADQLSPGDTRVSTVFKLFLSIEEEVTLRIPFREPSKDWRWKGRAHGLMSKKSKRDEDDRRAKMPFNKGLRREKGVQAGDVRPFAWFDLKVPASSTISLTQDMLPGPVGFNVNLDADISGLEILSSLNHGLLWRSNRITLNCDLANPLSWNGLREWVFNIGITGLDLFLLRDHTFLLVDLIADWSTGPLADFYLFTPFRYLLNVEFHDFKMYLNTNDANVVNSPEDLDDNNFVILFGRHLKADLIIPLDRFRPALNDITFNVDARNLGFELSLPPKNTLNIFLLKKDIASLSRVRLQGIYTLCNEVSPGLTETLTMEIFGEDFSIEFYGFVGRLLALVKENYFGEDVHFKTLDEYQRLKTGEETESRDTSLKQNDLDVMLDIKVENANLIIPAGLYSADEHLLLKVPAADVDLRVNNYYLELMVNASPLDILYTERKFLDGKYVLETSNPQLSIDGLQVFGHRLFGLGTAEPPYASNFDINAGVIRGECSSAFFGKAVQVAQAAALSFPDVENTSPLATSTSWDEATFVRFQCPDIRIGCPVRDEIVVLSVTGVKGTFNDLAGSTFSQRLNMAVPEVVIACCSREPGSGVGAHEMSMAETYAYIRTALTFNMLGQSANFSHQRSLQQDHIALHDCKSRRAEHLVYNSDAHTLPQESGPLSIPLPSLPKPIVKVWRRLQRPASSIPKPRAGSVASTSATYLESLQRHLSGPIEDPGSQDSYGLSSAYTLAPLKLDSLALNVQNVPRIGQEHQHDAVNHPNHDEDEDDTVFETGDTETARVSFLIDIRPGITILCTPRAIHCVSDLIEGVLPTLPEPLLDGFQATVMSSVFSALARQQNKVPQITDIGINVPTVKVRFVNAVKSTNNAASQNLADQYDVGVHNISVAVRLHELVGHESDEDAKYVHIKAGSLNLSAQETSSSGEFREAAFTTSVEDILVWLTQSTRTAINVSFNILEATLSSQQVKYLASLIHRTTLIAGEFQERFVNLANLQQRRQRHLFDRLISLREGMGDPVFLTIPSYVLRSSRARNNDSWRLISKMRHVLNNLPLEEFVDLATVCSSSKLEPVVGFESRLFTALDGWDAWDPLDVRRSIAVMTMLGSHADPQAQYDQGELPLGISLRAATVRAVIDPGNKQSSVSVDGIALGLEVTPPPPPSAVKIFQDFADSKMTVIQIQTTALSLHFNWEIFELVESSLKLFEQSAPQVVLPDDSSPEARGVAVDERFHIVFASDTAKLDIETLNLQGKFFGEGLKLSAGGHGWVPEAEEVSANVLLATSLSSFVLTAGQKTLIRASVTQPNLWCDYEKSSTAGRPVEVVRAAADSRELSFNIVEDVQGLLETADQVIRHEVLQIHTLASKHQSKSPVNAAKSRAPSLVSIGGATLLLDIAVFLDVYDVRVAVLPDLSYVTRGQVARLAVAPELYQHSTLKLDFDLKAQTHQMQVRSGQREVMGLPLHTPPLNGSIRLVQAATSLKLLAQVQMEQIELEGIAVYGFLSALTGPQFVQSLEVIKADSLALADTVQKCFPQGRVEQTGPKSTPAKALIYDVNFALTGFNISADAPSRLPGVSPSTIFFKLSSTQVRAANCSSDPDKALPFPELRLDLKEMSVNIRRPGRNRDRRAESSVPCGEVIFGALFTCTLEPENDCIHREFRLSAVGPRIAVYAETAPVIVEAIVHLQERVKGLDLTSERKYLRKLRQVERKTTTPTQKEIVPSEQPPNVQLSSTKMTSTFAVDIVGIELSYLMRDSIVHLSAPDPTNLVLSVNHVGLLARSEGEARLIIDEILLQMRSSSQEAHARSPNHALFPEVVFEVAYFRNERDRMLSFKSHGKALELYLEPRFLLPLDDVQRSISLSAEKFRTTWAEVKSIPTASGTPRTSLLGDRRISLLLVSAEFEGAVVSLQADTKRATLTNAKTEDDQGAKKYDQFVAVGAASAATLRAPGIAFRVQYSDKDGISESTLSFEINVSSSRNELSPSVVPLFLQVSESIKRIAQDPARETQPDKPRERKALIDEGTIVQADPLAVLGRTKLNVGFRIQEQSFALSCQPIARVGAQAQIKDIYLTFNTVDSQENGHFFAANATLSGFSVRVQHEYSRGSTFAFDMESIYISAMNSKHLSGTAGISAILRVNPTRAQINARQLQHVLLFREIWLPQEIRDTMNAGNEPDGEPSAERQDYFVQKYQQVAASTTFPWNASVGIAELAIDLDLGQGIGKSSLKISDFWVSSRKRTSAKQTLCIGVGAILISSTGRMSGLVDLEQVKIRTSIAFPAGIDGVEQTPLVQASIGFDSLKAKASFDYQPFAVADITMFEFIMYNVRDHMSDNDDRLVAILDSNTCNVYCISTAAALTLSLAQAFERLIQELQMSFAQSLRDIDRYLRRRTPLVPKRLQPYKPASPLGTVLTPTESRTTISLHTDVVVTIRSIDVGCFPSTLEDQQVLRLEASDIQARFAVFLDRGKIHSGLGLTLGQLRASLATASRPKMPAKLGEASIQDVVKNVTNSRGGVILRVPKVVASMQTWQDPEAFVIDYIFKSTFEGKIDVGWNFTRISFIKSMWERHSRNLAARVGRPLTQSAVKITGGPKAAPDDSDAKNVADQQRTTDAKQETDQSKITAVVNLPQSKYTYRALEPPVIETPQLRDMGEATPPLEWVGLHRDRLPNVTHQIVIVALLEIAKEVEDAYCRILGSA